MLAWGAAAAFAVACLVGAVASVRVGLRNLSAGRRAWVAPPLIEAEIVAAAWTERPVPRSWPLPATITDARVAAAYRDLARERRETWAMVGEIVVLLAGAALGVSVVGFIKGGRLTWLASFMTFVGAMGVAFRRLSESRLAVAAAGYERRRRELLRPQVHDGREVRLGRWVVTVARDEPGQSASH